MMVRVVVNMSQIGSFISELEGKNYVLTNVFGKNEKYDIVFSTDQTDIATVKSDIDTAVSNAGLTLYGYEVM